LTRFDILSLSISDFDYPLPADRIPEFPADQRVGSKLLAYRNGEIQSHTFYEIESLLNPGDLLVFNNTKVIKARLQFRKSTGAEIEIFLLEPFKPADYAKNFESTNSVTWICLIGNAKKWKSGELNRSLEWDGTKITIRIQKTAAEEGKYHVHFSWDSPVSFAELVLRMGEIPLPPYIHRKALASDEDRYQTVYARNDGSVAAPTAGLHFSETLLRRLREKGVNMAELTLHVGAGTFKPLSSELIGDHEMHSERMVLDRSFLGLIQGEDPITAVGTTSVRTLESLPYLAYLIQQGDQNLHIGQWMPYQKFEIPDRQQAVQIIIQYMDDHSLAFLEASTSIIIMPSFKFRMISNIITNFHLPKSTLLLLVSAFIGDDWKKVYQFALEHNFRFLSYGDSSILFGKQF
jgi:S-adenosylmethionine:tRNA ribosyltransferase-isomerase